MVAGLRSSAPPRRGRCLRSRCRRRAVACCDPRPLRGGAAAAFVLLGAVGAAVAILGPSEEGPLPGSGESPAGSTVLRSSAPPRRGRCLGSSFDPSTLTLLRSSAPPRRGRCPSRKEIKGGLSELRSSAPPRRGRCRRADCAGRDPYRCDPRPLRGGAAARSSARRWCHRHGCDPRPLRGGAAALLELPLVALGVLFHTKIVEKVCRSEALPFGTYAVGPTSRGFRA